MCYACEWVAAIAHGADGVPITYFVLTGGVSTPGYQQYTNSV